MIGNGGTDALRAGHGPLRSVGFGGMNPYLLLPGQAADLVTKTETKRRNEKKCMGEG
jgi:hypothetical protein